MERLSSFTTLDDSHESLRLASNRLGVTARRLIEWLRDKGRQLRALPGNEDLMRAVFSAEKSPVEGSRHRVGECLNVHNPNGELRRFKICGIQSGGFSNVYTVIDLDDMRPYCLKENRALPGDEQRKNGKLAIEAEISLRLGINPYLVTTYAAFPIRGRLFLLTEYIPSTSLDNHLKGASLRVQTALGYAIDLCRAMHYARETLPDFVHGDIKPGNCFVAADGNLKLGDFGLASALGVGKYQHNGAKAAEDWAAETSLGWGGTAAYMAPEMFDSVAPDRKSADIYAFGVTLFEMLGGKRPFVSSSKSELAEMHRHTEPPLATLTQRSVPSSVVDLIKQCLAKSPERRPVSFKSVENILRQSVQEPVEIFITTKSGPEQITSEIIYRSLSLALLGNSEESAALLNSAMQQKGTSPELLACKAIALSLTGRIDGAYEASTASLRIGSDLFVVLLAHAQVLISKGNLNAAENYLDRALRNRPDNCVALNLMGDLLKRIGQCEEARICFEKSSILDEKQAEPWEELANINLLAGKDAKAISLAEKALSIDPYRSISYRILGDAYRSKKQLIKAIKSYKSVLGLEPASKESVRRFVCSCCELYKAKGDRIGVQHIRLLIHAAAMFQNADSRRIAPNDFAIKFIEIFRSSDFNPLLLFFFDTTLGKLVADLDSSNSEELLEGLRIVRGRAACGKMSPHLLYSLGRILYQFGEYEYCRDVFKRMLNQFGPNENSYYYLAACSEIEEDFQSSLKFYKKALRIEDCEDTRTGISRVTAKIKQNI